MEDQNARDYTGTDCRRSAYCRSDDGGDMAERRVHRDDILERRMGHRLGVMA